LLLGSKVEANTMTVRGKVLLFASIAVGLIALAGGANSARLCQVFLNLLI
jgi:hypothetical protein